MTFHKFSVCAALMALTFTACDNSLPWDDKTTTGELRLNVSKKEPQHRRGSVDTQDFAVTITGKEEALAKVKREYNKVSDMPESITFDTFKTRKTATITVIAEDVWGNQSAPLTAKIG